MIKDKAILRGCFDMLCGKKLGEGTSRTVYECNMSDSLVVKVQRNADNFANAIEYSIWCGLMHGPMAKWLAPCRQISSCGRILVQERTTHHTGDYPTHMPAFLVDFKRTNYGNLADGSFVCHDYAGSLVTTVGANKRMKKVEWWDLNSAS